MKIPYHRLWLLLAWAGLLCCDRRTAADEYTELLDDAEATATTAAEKAPPLPFHSFEGFGGGAITPIAYLVNPGDECHLFGKPSVGLTYVGLGKKNLSAITVTQTIGQRVELGYAANQLGLGTLPAAIHALPGGVDIVESDIWLHHFNVRGLLVKENTCLGGLALPAITVGVDCKVNADIANINDEVGGALTTVCGYRRSNGQDYYLTASKMIPPDVLGRPIIFSGGLRLSNAANLGFLGFGEDYRATFEGNIVYLPLDNVALAYEFRQKSNPFTGTIPGVIEGEDNWHAFDLGLVLNKHTTLVAGYGIFGNLANAYADGAWWLQLKHEF